MHDGLHTCLPHMIMLQGAARVARCV